MAMKSDYIDQLRKFVAVVDARSFSAAARQLNVGQPAISKAVRSLEDRLGAPLFVRTTRAMSLTETGERFSLQVRAILDDLDVAEAEARGQAGLLEGNLRVCAPVTFARLHLLPRLKAFLDRYPGLSIDLILDDRRIDLVEERIDLALRAGPLADSTLVVSRLSSNHRVLVASADYCRTYGTPRSLADLLQHQLINTGRGSDWTLSRGDLTETLHVDARIRTNAAEGARGALLSGLGIGLVSRWIVEDALIDGRLVRLLPEWQGRPIDMNLVFPAGRRSSAKTRAFADWVRETLG